MWNTLLALIVFGVFIVGGIALQFFLSKQENKWFGLIMPIITICISLMAVLSVATFSTMSIKTETSLDSVIVNESNESGNKQVGDVGSVIIMIVTVFIVYNIPTAILLVIYFACREKYKRSSDLKKMTVQDL